MNNIRTSVSSFVQKKKRVSLYWMIAFSCAIIFSILVLMLLVVQVVNNSFGFVGIKSEYKAEDILNKPLDEATDNELRIVLKENIRPGIYRKLDAEKSIISRSHKDLQSLFQEHIIKERVKVAWTLEESLFKQKEIQSIAKEKQLDIRFRSWVNIQFLTRPQSSDADMSGIRTALLGTLLLIIIAMVFSIPIGVATALYLEEYALKTRLNKLIEINIYNLVGIPSIVYGLLGLAVFVRLLEPLTQGRTLFSAGLTLGLMCLPIIIINSQQALQSVPSSLRYSSYGLGATKWQTGVYHVLPYSFERILTSIILAMSRAVGETAPLVVVGAATFITTDPTGIFSKFTALPIQIYQWAARPQKIYQHTAAAAVIFLLLLIFILNFALFILRNNLSKQDKL